MYTTDSWQLIQDRKINNAHANNWQFLYILAEQCY